VFINSLPYSKKIHFLSKDSSTIKHISDDSFHTKVLPEYKIHFLIHFNSW
jgi:hypothetical protein